ncbi:MAG: hypothetical protein SF339_09460 [Blastocatellia bacterium]|nr:hypothetical protein [Blastocatellia bacterium]
MSRGLGIHETYGTYGTYGAYGTYGTYETYETYGTYGAYGRAHFARPRACDIFIGRVPTTDNRQTTDDVIFHSCQNELIFTKF